MPLRLVHLSDIHFQGYQAGWDEDHDQRVELLRDLERLVQDDGPMDGILVGGDIAFRASREEYETAAVWLDEVCKACGGLDRSQVWTVPGNHDVCRDTLRRSALAREFRIAVRACDLAKIDAELRQRLSVDPGAAGVLCPLDSYNAFAANFGCAITAVSPRWYDETLALDDGLTVHLTGLNSVLISDELDGDDDEKHKLILGMQQCRIPRKEGVVHVAIGHHPPTWLRDWPVIEPYLRRSHVLLFGHEHAFEARQLSPRGTVVVHAGAVGPDRVGGAPHGKYAPTYNIVTMQGKGDHIVVIVQPRYWSHGKTRFEAHPDGVARFEIAVDLEAAAAGAAPTGPKDGATMTEETAPSAAPLGPTEPDEPGALSDDGRPAAPLDRDVPTTGGRPAATWPSGRVAADLRRIGIDFMSRARTDRLDIARKLGVLREDDLALPEAELYPLLLRRIRDADLIDQLVEELTRA